GHPADAVPGSARGPDPAGQPGRPVAARPPPAQAPAAPRQPVPPRSAGGPPPALPRRGLRPALALDGPGRALLVRWLVRRPGVSLHLRSTCPPLSTAVGEGEGEGGPRFDDKV